MLQCHEGYHLGTMLPLQFCLNHLRLMFVKVLCLPNGGVCVCVCVRVQNEMFAFSKFPPRLFTKGAILINLNHSFRPGGDLEKDGD